MRADPEKALELQRPFPSGTGEGMEKATLIEAVGPFSPRRKSAKAAYTLDSTCGFVLDAWPLRASLDALCASSDRVRSQMILDVTKAVSD